METKEITKQIMQIREDVSSLQTEVKAAFKRIDEQRALVDTVHQLALTLRDMSGELKSVRMNVDRLQVDVDSFRSRPAKRWELIVTTCITGIAGAVIGAVTALIL